MKVREYTEGELEHLSVEYEDVDEINGVIISIDGVFAAYHHDINFIFDEDQDFRRVLTLICDRKEAFKDGLSNIYIKVYDWEEEFDNDIYLVFISTIGEAYEHEYVSDVVADDIIKVEDHIVGDIDFEYDAGIYLRPYVRRLGPYDDVAY